MKKILNKILNIPTSYMVTIVIISIILITLGLQGAIGLNTFVLVIILGVLFGLQVNLGSVVIKSVISGLIVLYVTSLYTFMSANVYGYVTQPFLLSVSAVTIFLSQTYSNKKHILGLRSRALWSSILIVTLVSIKITSMIFNINYWFVELIGLIYLIIYILLWRLWLKKSKKTKIIKPIILNEEVIGKFKYIYIDNCLNVTENKWTKGEFAKSTNAYPYIYNEVLKAHESKLLLIILSKKKTSEIYDVGEVKLNKSSKIPYLYMEAKSDEYKEDITLSFIEEITRNNKKW